MDGEGVTTSYLFLGQFNSLLGQEMSFEELEKSISCFVGKVIFLGHLFYMDVFWFSLVYCVGIILIFWSE